MSSSTKMLGLLSTNLFEQPASSTRTQAKSRSVAKQSSKSLASGVTTKTRNQFKDDLDERIIKAAQRAAAIDAVNAAIQNAGNTRTSASSVRRTSGTPASETTTRTPTSATRAKVTIQPGMAAGYTIPKQKSAETLPSAAKPSYDITAPDWMKRIVDELTGTGSKDKNRAHWEDCAQKAREVIRSYEAGENTYSRDTYESAKELLPTFQKNAENAVPYGLNRVGLAAKAGWNQFAGALGMVPTTLAAFFAAQEKESGKAYAGYMTAQRQEVLNNYAEMVSYLDPNNERDAATIRQLTEERDRQLQWLDNIEATYGAAGYGGKRRSTAEEIAGAMEEYVGTPARILLEAGSAQAQEAERGLGTVGQFVTRYGIAGTQMLLDVAASGGTSAMLPMMTRSFGMGAYEAEKNGGDVNEMIYQGTKRALIEYISEKLFAGNPVYDQGGGMVTDLGYAALYKTLGEEGAERLLRSTAARVMALPSDMLGEGLEEIVSDVANPLVDRLANALDGGNRDTTMPTWEELIMDGAVGAALGGTGHGVNALGASRQFGYMSRDNPYAAYMIDLLNTAAAENTAVPEDVMKNAKAIMPKATDAEIQEYYERYMKDTGQASESFAYNDSVDSVISEAMVDNHSETSVADNGDRDIIELEDIRVGRSLGAERRAYDIMDLATDEHFDLVDGSFLRNVKVFAGKGTKTPYRDAYKYADAIGGREEDWQHVKAIGEVDYYGEARKAEIHWSQCETLGEYDFFIKEWLE